MMNASKVSNSFSFDSNGCQDYPKIPLFLSTFYRFSHTQHVVRVRPIAFLEDNCPMRPTVPLRMKRKDKEFIDATCNIMQVYFNLICQLPDITSSSHTPFFVVWLVGQKVLDKDGLHFTIGFKLLSQLIFGNTLGQRTHEDLPGHTYHAARPRCARRTALPRQKLKLRILGR